MLKYTRVSIGLTDSRKKAKNLAIRRKSLGILIFSPKTC